jgi:hypothetical protein
MPGFYPKAPLPASRGACPCDGTEWRLSLTTHTSIVSEVMSHVHSVQVDHRGRGLESCFEWLSQLILRRMTLGKEGLVEIATRNRNWKRQLQIGSFSATW